MAQQQNNEILERAKKIRKSIEEMNTEHTEQIAAIQELLDFYEDCIAEMAAVVYA